MRPPEGLRIRPPRASDMDAICEIEGCSFKDPYPRGLLGWLASTDRGIFLVAELGGRVVGYVSVLMEGLRLAHLVSIAVDEGHRRMGVGEALLRAALEEARRRGARRAVLEVRASNEAARRLYEKVGFRQLGVIEGYYDDGEDAICMELSL